jgi:hypothetical protein
MRINMKAKRDEEHCWRCGMKYGEPYVLGCLAGEPILGSPCYRAFTGSVLCERCMDREEDEQMNRENMNKDSDEGWGIGE